MSNRLAGAVAGVAVLFIVGAAGPAAAADRDFCRDYAQAALRQVRGALHHQRCAEHMDNVTRWSPEYRDHFQWCLHVSKDTANDERDARRRVLEDCAH
jgi:hypothetical protein